jgi:hypothetical protein
MRRIVTDGLNSEGDLPFEIELQTKLAISSRCDYMKL